MHMRHDISVEEQWAFTVNLNPWGYGRSGWYALLTTKPSNSVLNHELWWEQVKVIQFLKWQWKSDEF